MQINDIIYNYLPVMKPPETHPWEFTIFISSIYLIIYSYFIFNLKLFQYWIRSLHPCEITFSMMFMEVEWPLGFCLEGSEVWIPSLMIEKYLKHIRHLKPLVYFSGAHSRMSYLRVNTHLISNDLLPMWPWANFSHTHTLGFETSTLWYWFCQVIKKLMELYSFHA